MIVRILLSEHVRVLSIDWRRCTHQKDLVLENVDTRIVKSIVVERSSHTDIRPYGPSEENRVLRNNRQVFANIMEPKLSNVHAVNCDRSYAW